MPNLKELYEVHFAYGGKYKGESLHTVSVEAESENDAMDIFKKTYNYEFIIHCKKAKKSSNITIDRNTIEAVIESLYHHTNSTSKIDKVLEKYEIGDSISISEALMKMPDAGLIEILEIENNF